MNSSSITIIDEILLPTAHAMNAGLGPHSYVKHSSYQRVVVDMVKPIIEEEIAKNLDIKDFGTTLYIADFGCSTGHNSFPAMQIIIEAIMKKQEPSTLTLDFCVLFNDIVGNDFNTLLSSLPPHRSYHAAAVAGDFHLRLLPSSSLHFAYSSFSLHWLTAVPEALATRGSPAWNEGRIFYARDGRKEVCDAYLEQFGKDMESFLKCRAVEIVNGGLMTLAIPGVPLSWNPQTDYTIPFDFVNPLESCLVDMAKKGRISETKMDSFNLPYYIPNPKELKAILMRSHSFSIQRMEILNNNPAKCKLQSVEARAAFYRAAHEELLAHYFGYEVIDELFDLYMKKLAASPILLNPNNDKSIMILVVLKRIIMD